MYVSQAGVPGIIIDVGAMFLAGPRREINYQANRAVPNLLPDFENLTMAYMKGMMSIGDYDKNCKYIGVGLGPWKWPDMRYMIESRHSTNEAPFFIYNSRFGHDFEKPFDAVVACRTYIPTIDEALQMRNRELISKNLFDFIIRRNTNADNGWEKIYNELRFIIPSVSDLITFSVREAFNKQVIEKYGYNKELPIEILPWLNKLGLSGGTNFPMPPGATLSDGKPDTRIKAQWYDHYWWSHWQLPSLTMGYEMLHRLYPTSRFGPSPDVMKDGRVDEALQFVDSDIETLHKTQDYPEYWRKRLAAMSYHPLTRTDVRRMRQVGVFKTPEEVYHAYRAIGYNDQNAWRLAQFVEELSKPKNRKINQTALKRLCMLRYSKIISEPFALAQMEKLGFSEDEAKAHLEDCQLQIYYDEFQSMYKTIRKQYLSGRIHQSKAINALENIVADTRDVQIIITRWNTQLNIKYRALTVSNLKKALKHDDIDDKEFETRMQNLGYSINDIKVILEEIQHELDAKAENDVKAGLAYFSVDRIKELFNDGILGKDDIVSILRGKKWLQYAIDTFLLKEGIE